MRSLLTTFLTGLILACPLLCGAGEVGCGAEHGHAAGSASDDKAPAHCPESRDNCVCQGAVQPSDVRASLPDVSLPAPLFLLAPPNRLAHPLPHPARDGAPAGLLGWGDSLGIRAFLQNFRL